jgi:hypothetical protein
MANSKNKTKNASATEWLRQQVIPSLENVPAPQDSIMEG